MARLVAFAVLAAALASPHLAFAQTGMMTSTGQGSCTGAVAANIGIAATRDPQAAEKVVDSVALSWAPYMFNAAECNCNTQDVFMRIQLSMCLPAGTQGNPTLWVGSSACSNYTTRTTTNQTQCQQYTASNVSANSFSAAGGNCSTTTFFDVMIPSRALFSPNVGSCDIQQASNQVFIFIGPDQTMPVATCTLPITEQVTGPAAVVNTSASSGDGAVTLSWESPPLGSLQPDSYQILCADENGMPIATNHADAAYSTCTPNGIRRRQNIFGASTVTTTADGGTPTADLGVASATSALQAGAQDSLWPSAVDDMGTDDMGTDDGGVDGGTTLTSPIRPTNSGLPAPFTDLDPAFVCSDRIVVTAQNYSRRVDGLVNNKKYQFVILSIDLFGNATASPIVEALPRPVDDLYSRYRSEGGTAQGFCFVATAAFGDYDHPQVRILREFRDRVLATSAPGRAFIRAYYASSPPLARFIAEGSFRRAVARAILWPVVGIALLAIELGSLSLALLLAAGLPALALWLRRRRAKRRSLIEVPA